MGIINTRLCHPQVTVAKQEGGLRHLQWIFVKPGSPQLNNALGTWHFDKFRLKKERTSIEWTSQRTYACTIIHYRQKDCVVGHGIMLKLLSLEHPST